LYTTEPSPLYSRSGNRRPNSLHTSSDNSGRSSRFHCLRATITVSSRS